MKYFDLLPNMNYGNIQIINLFYRYNIKESIPQEYIRIYAMRPGQSLEDVAYDVYNNTELWWVIALINDINDVFFDIMLSDNIIRTMAKDQSTYDGVLNQEDFITKYDFLSDENDKKQNINILSKDHITDFLSDMSRISEKNLFVDSLPVDLVYEPIDIIDFKLFINNDKLLIDSEGKLITIE